MQQVSKFHLFQKVLRLLKQPLKYKKKYNFVWENIINPNKVWGQR